MVDSNKNKSIKIAFLKIKKDIKQINAAIGRISQRTDYKIDLLIKNTDSKIRDFNDKCNQKIKTLSGNIENKSKKQVEVITTLIEQTSVKTNKNTEKSIIEINDSVDELRNSTLQKNEMIIDFIEVKKNIEKLNENFQLIENHYKEFDDRFGEINAKNQELEDTITLISNKLQEFENVSVDVEDVENNFITRDEFNKKLEKALKTKKIEKKLNKINKKILNFEEDIYKIISQLHII